MTFDGSSSSQRQRICVPSLFIAPQVKPPPLAPFPGTVTAESLRPPEDPPIPFLFPWKAFAAAEQTAVEGATTFSGSIPCTIDAASIRTYLHRHDVEHTLRTVFLGRSEAFIAGVLASLSSPFASTSASASADAPIWTLWDVIKPGTNQNTVFGGKKLKARHRVLRGPPWSVVSYADASPGGTIRYNMVYDDEGAAVAQIDFGHGATLGIHAHALVHGNLEHAAVSSDDHLFHLPTVPWFWMCIPDVRPVMPRGGIASGAPPPAADDSDDDAGDARGLKLFKLPSTIDDCHWVSVSVPREDFMGDQINSDEW